LTELGVKMVEKGGKSSFKHKKIFKIEIKIEGD